MNRLAAAEDHAAVLRLLERTFTVRCDPAFSELPIWATIRYALSAHYVGESSKSLAALKTALTRLDRGLGGFTPDDREYLYFLCKWIATSLQGSREAHDLAMMIGGSFENIRLKGVSRVLKLSFPIRAADAREIDAYVESHIARVTGLD